MSTREISKHLEEIDGVEVGRDTISRVTDAVLDDVKEWQARPLEKLYLVVWLDAIVLKIRDQGSVRNKHAYLAVGVGIDGMKETLGIWLEANEGAKFWLRVISELKARGVEDILVFSVDGLKGFPQAIEAVYPQARERPLDRALRSFAHRQPACRALIANLYGVGAISATAILAELGDCRRFASSDDAVRHSGLDVTVHQSDNKRSAGHLSHQGPELLRWALFEAAHQSARRSSPGHDYYLQVAGRIDHNRACLSVARKLCRRAHHILRELGDQALAPVESEPQAEEAMQAAA